MLEKIKIPQILAKLFLKEVFLVFLFVVTVNNYIGKTEKTITADGIGYYDYLPSIFIHHDFVRNTRPLVSDSSFYERIIKLNGAYVGAFDYKIDKYPIGVALLQMPFFVNCWLGHEPSLTLDDGYQLPYHRALYYAGIFYLFLGLIFFAKLLRTYQFNEWLIFFAQVCLIFATPLAYYTCYEPSFSHVYSLFAICAGAYFARSYFLQYSTKDFLWAIVFLGLIILLRQINVLVLLFIPFLSGSSKAFGMGVLNLFTKDFLWLKASVILIAMVMIQASAWYLQCGKWVLYSYREEDGFNFLKPEILNILFSYQKGLFVYTPIAFLSISGLVTLLYTKRYFEVLTWLLGFGGITYVFSSWWCWYYGCSFGNRAFIEFLPFFLILLCILINDLNRYLRILPLLLCFLCIPLNLVQTYQYKEFILHWMDMNKERYWKIFGQTEKQYVGLIWTQAPNYNEFELVQKIQVGNVKFSSNNDSLLFETIMDSSQNSISLISISFNTVHQLNNDSRINLALINSVSSKYLFEHYTYLNHFFEGEGGQYKNGVYNFEIKPGINPAATKLEIKLNTKGKLEVLDSFSVLTWKKRVTN